MKKNYIIMSNNGEFIHFTPSAMAEGSDEHVTISMITPKPFTRKHQMNDYYGRREIAAHIPAGFNGTFYLYIMVGRGSNAKRFRLWIEAEDGAATLAAFLPDDHNLEEFNEPIINIRFPYQAWEHYPNTAWCRY